MVTTLTTAAWFLPFVVPIAIWVSWSDMATMKIPNKAVAALLVVFVVLGLIAVPFTDYIWRYVHFAVVLAICFFLNMVRVLGAGDAKFAAAMAPFIALGDWLPFMYLLGGVMIAAFVSVVLLTAFLYRRRQGLPNWVRVVLVTIRLVVLSLIVVVLFEPTATIAHTHSYSQMRAPCPWQTVPPSLANPARTVLANPLQALTSRPHSRRSERQRFL